MFFQQITDGGCQSYVLGCPDTCAAAVIDPALSQIDRYVGIAHREGLRIRKIIETHTHADHFSAARQMAAELDVPWSCIEPAPHRGQIRAWKTGT